MEVWRLRHWSWAPHPRPLTTICCDSSRQCFYYWEHFTLQMFQSQTRQIPSKYLDRVEYALNWDCNLHPRDPSSGAPSTCVDRRRALLLPKAICLQYHPPTHHLLAPFGYCSNLNFAVKSSTSSELVSLTPRGCNLLLPQWHSDRTAIPFLFVFFPPG